MQNQTLQGNKVCLAEAPVSGRKVCKNGFVDHLSDPVHFFIAEIYINPCSVNRQCHTIRGKLVKPSLNKSIGWRVLHISLGTRIPKAHSCWQNHPANSASLGLCRSLSFSKLSPACFQKGATAVFPQNSVSLWGRTGSDSKGASSPIRNTTPPI